MVSRMVLWNICARQLCDVSSLVDVDEEYTPYSDQAKAHRIEDDDDDPLVTNAADMGRSDRKKGMSDLGTVFSIMVSILDHSISESIEYQDPYNKDGGLISEPKQETAQKTHMKIQEKKKDTGASGRNWWSFQNLRLKLADLEMQKLALGGPLPVL